MAATVAIEERLVGADAPVYVIAEIGINQTLFGIVDRLTQ